MPKTSLHLPWNRSRLPEGHVYLGLVLLLSMSPFPRHQKTKHIFPRATETNHNPNFIHSSSGQDSPPSLLKYPREPCCLRPGHETALLLPLLQTQPCCSPRSRTSPVWTASLCTSLSCTKLPCQSHIFTELHLFHHCTDNIFFSFDTSLQYCWNAQYYQACFHSFQNRSEFQPKKGWFPPPPFMELAIPSFTFCNALKQIQDFRQLNNGMEVSCH